MEENKNLSPQRAQFQDTQWLLFQARNEHPVTNEKGWDKLRRMLMIP